MPTQWSAASRACHARPQATSAASSSNRGGGSRLAASHDRTSAAKACSSSVNARSMVLEVPEPLAPGGGEVGEQLGLVLGGEGPVGDLVAPPVPHGVAGDAVRAVLLQDQAPLQDLVRARRRDVPGEAEVPGAPLRPEVGLLVDPRPE